MSRSTAVKLAVVVAIVIAVILTLAAGGFDLLRDQDRVQEFLTDSGPWGPILFILAFVALQPLSLPGAVLIIPATFVWSWWEVAIYSLSGGMVASTIGFVLARWLGQAWVRRRLPARLQPWEQRLAEHGLVATVALRLLTGYAPVADWLLGVSRVSVPAFGLGTLIGLAPTTVATSIWGDDAVRGLVDSPALTLVISAGLIAAAIVTVAIRKGRRDPAERDCS
jgi:uncharacterized membrane protein YdjX (TVP38/TMEM64 family)